MASSHHDKAVSADAAFRKMVEAANAGIWVLDPSGVTTFANTKMAQILGYSHNEMTALSLFDVLDQQGRDQAARNLERRRQGMADQLECTFIRKDGSHTWVLLGAGPLLEDGQFAGSLCVVSELPGRERLVQTLHRREQQLAEAQRVAHLGSWEWDVASDTVTWSDELYRIFGLTPQELEPTYEGYLSRVHHGDREMAEEAVGAALGSGDAFEFQIRIVRPGGEVVWTQSRGQVTRDQAGVALRMQGTALDITNAKHTEQALRTTTERYRLLQAMAVAANEASTMEEALRAAVEHICAHTAWAVGHVYLPCEDAGGRLLPAPISHLQDPDRFAALRAAGNESFPAPGLADQASASRAPAWTAQLGEDSHLTAARSEAVFGLHAALAFPVVLGDEVVAVLEFFSEAAVEPDDDLLETLAQVGTQLARVAERQRSSAELAMARDAAREASRLKSAFLATMSHEIRTPMNGVIGLTGLLLGTELDERQRHYAEGVQSAGEALLVVINDILDFSKIEAGKLELEEVAFDLVQVVEEATELVAQSARRKGLELVAYCHPDVPTTLVGDPGRIRQVLANLASNAVKFTADGEVVVRARASGSSARAALIRFEVVDTGIGIAAGDQHRLFESFSQADVSTTRRFGGTGLGLAISRQLVEAMGGELGVDSEPGRGSTFWFTLPLGQPPPGTTVPPARAPTHLLQGLRVLVVDDNDTNRLILSEQLRSWGMRPDLAEDARSALARLQTMAQTGEAYAVALLDLCMEEMDGLALARRVSGDPAPPRLVLLSSSVDVGPQTAADAGVAAVLTKPVRQSQLYDCLLRVMAPAAAAPESPAPPVVGRGAGARGRRGHVLVVEDNPINQMVAQGVLEELGFSADVAANGLEALEALERTDYAAVLMDCQMPEMDGYAATAAIRHREGTGKHTPIVAMTAAAVEGDRERCLASGMDDYLSKPVQPDHLRAALDRWVGNDHAGGATRPGDDEHSSPAQVLDHERLGTLAEALGGRSFLNGLLAAFVTGTPEALGVLRQAIGAADTRTLRQAAHRLRGTAANLGAPGMAGICAELEALDSADHGAADDLFRSLQAEFDRVVDALRAYGLDQ